MTSETGKAIPYTKWTEEQFIEEVGKHPEYSAISGDFVSYWTEPDPKGTMRFQKEKAWETGRRLGTWQRRSEEKKAVSDPVMTFSPDDGKDDFAREGEG